MCCRWSRLGDHDGACVPTVRTVLLSPRFLFLFVLPTIVVVGWRSINQLSRQVPQRPAQRACLALLLCLQQLEVSVVVVVSAGC